jgi:hypothetical protein
LEAKSRFFLNITDKLVFKKITDIIKKKISEKFDENEYDKILAFDEEEYGYDGYENEVP